jgi:hypothetical protein
MPIGIIIIIYLTALFVYYWRESESSESKNPSPLEKDLR